MKTNLFSKELYPTPPEVIERMMMGEDFVGKTILEPSAGTGPSAMPTNTSSTHGTLPPPDAPS